MISKKCQYAIRALLELIHIGGSTPVKTAQIASAQGVSPRFMEIILNNLKNGGFIESRRGSDGGYLLNSETRSTCVLEIIECIDGPVVTAKAVNETDDFYGKNALDQLWDNTRLVLNEVYNTKTLAELCREEKMLREQNILNYVI